MPTWLAVVLICIGSTAAYAFIGGCIKEAAYRWGDMETGPAIGAGFIWPIFIFLCLVVGIIAVVCYLPVVGGQKVFNAVDERKDEVVAKAKELTR